MESFPLPPPGAAAPRCSPFPGAVRSVLSEDEQDVFLRRWRRAEQSADFDDAKSSPIAVLISGQSSRLVSPSNLKKHVVAPNDLLFDFHVFVDLTNSSHALDFDVSTPVISETSLVGEERVREFQEFATSIDIRRRPRLLPRQVESRLSEWSEKDKPEQSDNNMQQLYTKLCLCETVERYEESILGRRFEWVLWFREDAFFTNDFDLSFLLEETPEEKSVWRQTCKEFGGMNEKGFVLSRSALPDFAQVLFTFYDPSVPSWNFQCFNLQDCYKQFFEHRGVSVKGLSTTEMPYCDSIIRGGEVFFRVAYCEGCLVPFDDREDKAVLAGPPPEFCGIETGRRLPCGHPQHQHQCRSAGCCHDLHCCWDVFRGECYHSSQTVSRGAEPMCTAAAGRAGGVIECKSPWKKSREEMTRDHCRFIGCCWDPYLSNSFSCYHKQSPEPVCQRQRVSRSLPQMLFESGAGVRAQCGPSLIGPNECERRGCCWGGGGKPSCFARPASRLQGGLWRSSLRPVPNSSVATIAVGGRDSSVVFFLPFLFVLPSVVLLVIASLCRRKRRNEDGW
uniref:P-type domain-containing protein n=1 Tax=Chromera velia CCMP2878 TaxID=1169474 RepID=A0A0G4HWR5_9ALVE|eukprot:Cvel_9133.t1-p1 / transcript=Cvel_9133.t1 / gene=Cvel_9133 / organism=Chromera_velia_CCMP2878 / gene_product=hypothetical protein / transcript_product=hypothetical protein / location=Cvel_scaffold519:38204-39886(-) / protein_length=561 / sequence_SO=supercontig / SO=protein_coding / is_pseudo=false